VYPAENWGDIIPPYDYIDQQGNLQQFVGYNWTEQGQAIYGNGCDPPTPPAQPKPLTPIVRCVEATANGLLAHFSVANPNATTIEPATSDNVFTPDPGDRGQPASFAAGLSSDVVQVSLSAGAVTWHLTGNEATASSDSSRCPGASITVTKQLLPADDPGHFDLEVNGQIEGGASEVGNGGTTGTIAVVAGEHTVSESGAAGTSLDDYRTQIACRANGGTGAIVSAGTGSSLGVQVGDGDEIVCTITNEAKTEAKDVRPVLNCVVFNGDRPVLADWGYSNTSDVPVDIPIGKTNTFSPAPADRNQPTTFQAGTFVGVFQTGFGTGEDSLTWTLSSHPVKANASSPRCTATVEVQKNVVPASDPGVFNLQINGHTLAKGGDGAKTGPVTVGVGEATVSETAGPGTNLAYYDSSVVCARNGTVEISIPGTKVDAAVKTGDVVVCRFTNVRHGTHEPPKPPNPEPPTPTPPGPNPPTVIPPPNPGPAPLLDLEVVKTGKPAAVHVGGRITWTMTVTNRSSVEAADVNGLKVNDPRSFQTKLISLKTSQGTCRPYVCDLGRLAPGASANVIAVTRALRIGPVVDTVRVGSEEIESDYRNNIASALVRVIGALRPPKAPTICRTLTAAPRLLQAERTSVVLLTARNRLGLPLVGFPLRARGAGTALRARTGGNGVARVTVAPARSGLIVFAGGRRRVVHRPTCITVLAALRVKPTHVTG
jgi:hypothetical protein